MESLSAYSNRFQDGSRLLFNRHVAPTLPYWIAGGLTGLVASAYAALFRRLSAFSERFFSEHFATWALAVPVLFFASRALVVFFSPSSSGSGIPQVMSAIESLEHCGESWLKKILGFRMILVKVLSSTVMVLAGGAIGREGPTIHIGAGLFLMVEDFFRGRKFILRKDPTASRKAFILAGGAAGIAAAFNTPLGGIVFAIEELATDSFKQFRTTVITGVIVAGVTAQALVGSYLYLGTPTIPKVTGLAIAEAAILGIVAGGAGAFFGRSLFRLLKWRREWTGWKKETAWVLSCSALFIGLAAASGGYSLGGGSEGIGRILFENQSVSFIHAPIRFISTQLCYLVGGAGGIFSPALSIGANLGAWLAQLVPAFQADSHLLVLAGMAAFLTGVTHAPFTSLVLVLEMTNKSSAIFSLMLATMAAHWISKAIDTGSFYERVQESFFNPQRTPDPAPHDR